MLKNIAADIRFEGLGIMSGTSVDGLDIVATSFIKTGNRLSYQITAAETIYYTEEWVARLLNASTLSGNDLLMLDASWSVFVAEQINAFINRHSITPGYIASHGHTVFHQPENGFSFQIGSGAMLASLTGITTVTDFRRSDVALGGQGAPLVPIGDLLLFDEYKFCLNLGGFANVSVKDAARIQAFDICPLNVVMNKLARNCGQPYDKNGELARTGSIDNSLLTELEALPFYQQTGPKSLGTEWVDTMIQPILNRHGKISAQDQLATFTEHAARRIGSELTGDGKTLVTGGGAKNIFLMERIAACSEAEVSIPDAILTDFKEGLIFSLLGLLRLHETANVLTEVTGAGKAISAGAVYLGR